MNKFTYDENDVAVIKSKTRGARLTSMYLSSAWRNRIRCGTQTLDGQLLGIQLIDLERVLDPEDPMTFSEFIKKHKICRDCRHFLNDCICLGGSLKENKKHKKKKRTKKT
jgi:hypothetical protein